VNRQPPCGSIEARNRLRVARMYLEVAELAAEEQVAEARNVAAGNAVLAGIAASDAICCARLGRRHRGPDHQGALGLLRLVQPDGSRLAADLATVLGIKDPAHYGDHFVGDSKLKATLRAAARLVEAAEAIAATS
jgi:hypothetical protein